MIMSFLMYVAGVDLDFLNILLKPPKILIQKKIHSIYLVYIFQNILYKYCEIVDF